MHYQIYVDRNDGRGPVLDGCWGSENARFTREEDGVEALGFLAKQYPDCDWVLMDRDDTEVARIEASGEDEE